MANQSPIGSAKRYKYTDGTFQKKKASYTAEVSIENGAEKLIFHITFRLS